MDGEPVRLRGRTDASGRATFERVPCETIVVSVDPETVPAGVRGGDDLKRIFWSPDSKPVEVRLREERVFRGTLVREDGSPSLVGPSRSGRLRCQGWGASAWGSRSHRAPAARPPELRREVPRTTARGEFALRITSMEDFTPVDATRIVTLEGGQLELQKLVPLRPTVLHADGENRLVMRKDSMNRDVGATLERRL